MDLNLPITILLGAALIALLFFSSRGEKDEKDVNRKFVKEDKNIIQEEHKSRVDSTD